MALQVAGLSLRRKAAGKYCPQMAEAVHVADFTSTGLLSEGAVRAAYPSLPQSELENARRFLYVQSFDLDRCYPVFQRYTTATTFVTLSEKETRMLYDAHVPFYEWQEATSRTALIKLVSHSAVLRAVSARIDAAREVLHGDGVFVKLTSRSPKDVAVRDASQQFTEHLHAAVRRVLQDSGTRSKPDDANTDPAAVAETTLATVTDPRECVPIVPRREAALSRLNQEMLGAMRVTSGLEALVLLLRSQRVHQDLGQLLQLAPHLHIAAMIAVRSWSAPLIQASDSEFRCFIHQNRLTAITPYDDLLYSQKIAAAPATLFRNIRLFWREQLQAALSSFGSYILDVVILAKGEVHVLELNPFHIGAGTGLFRWRTDRQLLLEGRDGDTVVRWLRCPLPWETVSLGIPLARIVDEECLSGRATVWNRLCAWLARRGSK